MILVSFSNNFHINTLCPLLRHIFRERILEGLFENLINFAIEYARGHIGHLVAVVPALTPLTKSCCQFSTYNDRSFLNI